MAASMSSDTRRPGKDHVEVFAPSVRSSAAEFANAVDLSADRVARVTSTPGRISARITPCPMVNRPRRGGLSRHSAAPQMPAAPRLGVHGPRRGAISGSDVLCRCRRGQMPSNMGEDRPPTASCCPSPTSPLAARGTMTSERIGHDEQFPAQRRSRGSAPSWIRVLRQLRGPEARRAGHRPAAREWKAFPTRRAGSPRCPFFKASARRHRRSRWGGFVDHADHAQRRAHALDVEPVRPVPFRDQAPTGSSLRRRPARRRRRMPSMRA